jgi:hypothetical protein
VLSFTTGSGSTTGAGAGAGAGGGAGAGDFFFLKGFKPPISQPQVSVQCHDAHLYAPLKAKPFDHQHAAHDGGQQFPVQLCAPAPQGAVPDALARQ